MSPSPFTQVPSIVDLPPGLPSDPVAAVQQVFDVTAGYFNNGAPGQYSEIQNLQTLVSQLPGFR